MRSWSAACKPDLALQCPHPIWCFPVPFGGTVAGSRGAELQPLLRAGVLCWWHGGGRSYLCKVTARQVPVTVLVCCTAYTNSASWGGAGAKSCKVCL